jgi:hypothetical protein
MRPKEKLAEREEVDILQQRLMLTKKDENFSEESEIIDHKRPERRGERRRQRKVKGR